MNPVITNSITVIRTADRILALFCPFIPDDLVNIEPFPHRIPSSAIVKILNISAPNKSPIAKSGAFTVVIDANDTTSSGQEVINARINIPIRLAENMLLLHIISA